MNFGSKGFHRIDSFENLDDKIEIKSGGLSFEQSPFQPKQLLLFFFRHQRDQIGLR